ncbi:MAG: HoxN/HupN/NixA family nickel/cobalt transporter [Conexibacter sp.]
MDGPSARGIRQALTPAQWRCAAGLAAAVAGLHVLGFATLLAYAQEGILGLGLGITAYTLGLRHAFDADHIAAIDNVTRRLMADGQRPLGVGFWFSLGHSTIVFALAFLFALGVRGLGGAVEHDGSALQQATGTIGPLVSGAFLFLIGLLNLVVLVGIVGVARRIRRGDCDEAELARRLERRGFMSRVYARCSRTIERPWQMYPLGVLFGLGFDTATEIALLVIAGGAAASGLPFYAILCLPVLFAAGMSLLDTLDGAFMSFAYGWAFAEPARELYYNLTVTALSVAVALLIGTVELLAVLADRLTLTGGLWDVVSAIDLNEVGYLVVALFVVTWALAFAVWRLGRIEQRWSASDGRSR